jgi:hypothetical protein
MKLTDRTNRNETTAVFEKAAFITDFVVSKDTSNRLRKRRRRKTKRDRRRTLRFTSVLPSSGMLRSLCWFRTDVSGLRIRSIFKVQDVQEGPRVPPPPVADL